MALSPVCDVDESGKRITPQPMTKIKVYFVNEDGTFKQKSVPLGGGTISYNHIRDYFNGWITERTFTKVQNLLKSKMQKQDNVSAPQSYITEHMRTIDPDYGKEAKPKATRKRGRPSKKNGQTTKV